VVLPAVSPDPPGLRDLTGLTGLRDLARPVSSARENLLPVAGPLVPLLPDGGLVRGRTVTITGPGATSLALHLMVDASRAGSWVAVVGLCDLAPVAVVDAGLDPSRVAFIDPGVSGRQAEVIAALVGAVDIVMVDARLALRAAEVRRVASRLRERGSVLLVVRPGFDATSWGSVGASSTSWSADLAFTVRADAWEGPERGSGHLCSRRVCIETGGRGRAARPRQHALRLPDVDGCLRADAPDDGLPSDTPVIVLVR
jgi:hypothetical protein